MKTETNLPDLHTLMEMFDRQGISKMIQLVSAILTVRSSEVPIDLRSDWSTIVMDMDGLSTRALLLELKANSMPRSFAPGDLVKYTQAFLKRTDWHSGVPQYGIITGFEPGSGYPRVRWHPNADGDGQVTDPKNICLTLFPTVPEDMSE